MTCLSGFRLVCRALRSGDLGAIFLACIWALIAWITKPNEFRHQSHIARKNANGFWNVAVTWGNGRGEQKARIKLRPPLKNTSRRSWPRGMRAKSYF